MKKFFHIALPFAFLSLAFQVALASEAGVNVEVIEKEVIDGDQPKCKLHFQFSNNLDQKIQAKITSYQVLGTEKLTFGMTGEKKVKPGAQRISKIGTNSACSVITKIAVQRASCNLVNEEKEKIGSCEGELKLVDNELIVFEDKRS